VLIAHAEQTWRGPCQRTHRSRRRASRRHLARLRCRCLNLDFGRSWRWSLRQARRGRIIAWDNDARERKRQRENRPVGHVTQNLGGARSHKRAVLAAVGHRRLIRTARHFGGHSHCRVIAHGFVHRCSRRHRRRRHRGQQQTRDRECGKKKAEGGWAFHLFAIPQVLLLQNRFRHNSVTGRTLRTALSGLNGRTWHRTVRTIDAAIARQRLEPLVAALAVIKKLASVRRHLFDHLMAAFGAGDDAFSLHLYMPTIAASTASASAVPSASPFSKSCPA
jgi:hypothetical protein